MRLESRALGYRWRREATNENKNKGVGLNENHNTGENEKASTPEWCLLEDYPTGPPDDIEFIYDITGHPSKRCRISK